MKLSITPNKTGMFIPYMIDADPAEIVMYFTNPERGRHNLFADQPPALDVRDALSNGLPVDTGLATIQQVMT
jgi:hypothetical protein